MWKAELLRNKEKVLSLPRPSEDAAVVNYQASHDQSTIEPGVP